jgi:hypothetical protein
MPVSGPAEVQDILKNGLPARSLAPIELSAGQI